MPLVITAGCLRKKYAFSSCQRCITVCDTRVLTVTDNGVQLDEPDCCQCGRCVVACPVNAIVGVPPARHSESGCLVSSAAPEPSLKELLLYYAAGVSTIRIASEHSGWWRSARRANACLALMEKPPFRLEASTHRDEPLNHARRALFGLRRLADALNPVAITLTPLPQAFPGFQFTRLEVEASRCSLCLACVRVCPTGAISVSVNALTFDGARCNDCQLCQDACPARAIALIPEIRPLRLTHFRIHFNACSACGEPYAALRASAGRCPPCQIRQQLHIPASAIGQRSLQSTCEDNE